jgi:hypothetical protein
MTTNKTLFGFEMLSSDRMWRADLVGEQGASNLFETHEAAEAELPNLASVLECQPGELRVVAMGETAFGWRAIA